MTRWAKSISVALILIILLLVSLVGPIDKSPLTEKTYYQEMIGALDTMRLIPDKKNAIYAGWEKISITPENKMPMAGYRIRKSYDGIHDSLYSRIIVLHINQKPVYLISVDLLLFPPALKEALKNRFTESPMQPMLYLGATHTHNGIGGWHDSAIGNLSLGDYNEEWVTMTSQKIFESVVRIEKNLARVHLSYWQADATEYAENRLVKSAPYDGMLRGIRLTRADSTSAHLITFSAHATSISKTSRLLSGDYPAALTDSLTNENQFVMFMAGMVGSHRLTGFKEEEFDLVAAAGKALAKKIDSADYSFSYDSTTLIAQQIPIKFGPSQLRILEKWKLRDWAFQWLVNPLRGELSYLQLNNIVLIGTPCDFSGELYVNYIDAVARMHDKKVIITSFNGEYNGYITEDMHYFTEKKEEVMALNWVGPYHGAYFSKMINTLVSK